MHRDFEPANIKISPEGCVKVLDLGLARVLIGSGAEAAAPGIADPSSSRVGGLLGTVAYMSPEQARGQSDSVESMGEVYLLEWSRARGC